MTSQISKSIVIMIACLFMAVSNVNAQQQQQQLPMAALIGQSLSKLQDYTPEKALTCIAELKRIEAMFPDSIQPKHQAALQSLYYAVQFPQDLRSYADAHLRVAEFIFLRAKGFGRARHDLHQTTGSHP